MSVRVWLGMAGDQVIVIAEDDDTYAPLAEPGARPAEGVTCPTCPSRCAQLPVSSHPAFPQMHPEIIFCLGTSKRCAQRPCLACIIPQVPGAGGESKSRFHVAVLLCMCASSSPYGRAA